MSSVSSKIMTTVNASYKNQVTAEILAEYLTKKIKYSIYTSNVIAFFTEVSLPLQIEFIYEMGLSIEQVKDVAKFFSHFFGRSFPIELYGEK